MVLLNMTLDILAALGGFVVVVVVWAWKVGINLSGSNLPEVLELKENARFQIEE